MSSEDRIAALEYAAARTRTPTVVLFGDSRTDDCDVTTSDLTDATSTAALNSYSTNLSWFDWGQAFLTGGPVLDVIRNAGVGGNTTIQMLARMGTDVLAYKPSHMTLWGGTNDGWATTADVDASVGRMVSMMQAARTAGIYVFLISETVSSTKGATFNTLVLYYNERLRLYAAQNPGVEYWDFNSVFMNPLSTTGTPNALMTRDGLHLSALGAITIGQQVVATKLARFPSITALTASLIDTMGNNTNVRNILSNQLMTTAGGTNGGSDTGALPGSWAATGTPTAAHSSPARTDGYGNDLQAVITNTPAGSNGKFYNQTLNTARIVPGVAYVLEAAFSITSPVNLYGLSLIVQMFTSGGTYQRGWGLNEQATNATDLTSATGDTLSAIPAGTIRSRLFSFPTGQTYTSASLALTARFAGTGSATITLGRVSIKRADS